ncbi:MAG: hypothetical protein FFODKBPE_00060 [Candidatus Argoarchaeum ethanivorans]|uniref:Uncharacterized protein n=1 Tax=Candidatus Argoarchaeum ethanivorans TaxID=2608793 RepID=A0A811T1B4_9EURY|nr:MAG: hypothetical protein FFODKBPE_00060 [Candidatus Argoarchaeum ethanivorans]
MTRVLLVLLIAAAVCMASAGVGAADEVNVTLEGITLSKDTATSNSGRG